MPKMIKITSEFTCDKCGKVQTINGVVGDAGAVMTGDIFTLPNWQEPRGRKKIGVHYINSYFEVDLHLCLNCYGSVCMIDKNLQEEYKSVYKRKMKEWKEDNKEISSDER